VPDAGPPVVQTADESDIMAQARHPSPAWPVAVHQVIHSPCR
jgi:hypothetical protein